MTGSQGEFSKSPPTAAFLPSAFLPTATPYPAAPHLWWPALFLRSTLARILKSGPFIGTVLSITCLYCLIAFDRPLIRGDGVAYLAWVDSITLDGDIDLANQAEKFQPSNSYQIVWHENTEKYVTVFPFGAAFLQAPFYKLGDIFYHQGWWNQNPDYFRQMQGIPQSYSLWLMIGANVMALASVLIAWRVGRQLTDNATAALTAFAFLIGTPLIYYSTTDPLNSHNPGAFMCTCFIYCLSRVTGGVIPNEQPIHVRSYWWIGLGISVGLMVLSRWQLLLIALPAWGLLAWQRQWKGAILAGIVTAITLLPLPIFWNYLFHQPFTVPYDAVEQQSFLRPPVHTWDVLKMTILHSPIIVLSLFGLFFLWRINRAWAFFCGAAIALQILINGAALDWYAGDSFGMRRMSELYPIYVVVARALLGNLHGLPQLKPTHFRWIASRAIVLVLIPLAFLHIRAFYVYTWSDQGKFADTPRRMIQFYLDHPYREEFEEVASKAHIGPEAWAKPGP
ncbi:MAG: phospholipid carrier-dependent glycosyltransferase [Chloroflexi bacterium]|nr:phospholipid carrier-dependent glycosyltransferase [Chloroflexota bacterium]NOG66422.1 phospholipid carrier-dependent glycosyltransferase [Chloroflexota bacterium]